jgi:hypothetical protein
VPAHQRAGRASPAETGVRVRTLADPGRRANLPGGCRSKPVTSARGLAGQPGSGTSVSLSGLRITSMAAIRPFQDYQQRHADRFIERDPVGGVRDGDVLDQQLGEPGTTWRSRRAWPATGLIRAPSSASPRSPSPRAHPAAAR